MDRFEAMQMFVRVVEAGSFAAVADELQVARSVVTRQVAALEGRLKVKLLARTTRSLSLTPAGQAYLDKCRTILGMVDAAESDLAQDQSLSGRIRLSLPLYYSMSQLMPALMSFAKAHPQVHLQLNFSDERANLVEEGIDLAIRITADVQPTDILRRIGQVSLLTVASPAYLKARGTPRAPEDLPAHDCLVYAGGTGGHNWQYRRAGQPVTVRVSPRLVSNNGMALAQAACEGLGIALLPDFIISPFEAQGQVVEVLKTFRPPRLGIFAVLPSNSYIPRRVSALIEQIAAAIGTQATGVAASRR